MHRHKEKYFENKDKLERKLLLHEATSTGIKMHSLNQTFLTTLLKLLHKTQFSEKAKKFSFFWWKGIEMAATKEAFKKSSSNNSFHSPAWLLAEAKTVIKRKV